MADGWQIIGNFLFISTILFIIPAMGAITGRPTTKPQLILMTASIFFLLTQIIIIFS